MGKKPKIHTFTDYELKQHDNKIFHRALITFLCAAYEEFQWQDDEAIVRLASRLNKYDFARKEHLINFTTMEKLLSGETGIRFNPTKEELQKADKKDDNN